MIPLNTIGAPDNEEVKARRKYFSKETMKKQEACEEWNQSKPVDRTGRFNSCDGIIENPHLRKKYFIATLLNSPAGDPYDMYVESCPPDSSDKEW